MATRTRSIDEARRTWRRTAGEIGDQLRTARLMVGVTQAHVGAAIGVSQREVSRRERGRARVAGESLAAHAAAVGLRVSVNLWPVGGEIRDAAQARYVAAFVGRVGRMWRVTLEAPVQVAGDLRAVDVLLVRGDLRIAVEVITRLADGQAQVRAAVLKARDIGATRLILAVAGTRSNRRALAQARGALISAFDLDTRRLMNELAAGRDTGRDGVVLL
jgi:transcriptional regulator with XRE-family HTH domain